MCQTGGYSNFSGMQGCACGCCECGCGPSFRRFFSAKEKQESLEIYKDQLKKELAGVEERINKVKGN